MEDDIQVGSGQIAPQESLRDQISSALAEVKERQEAEAPAAQPDAEKAAGAPVTDDKPQPVRGPDGKFASAPKPQEGAPAAAAAEPVGKPVAEPKAPEGWPADVKGMFKTLPPQVQAAIAKREEDIHKFVSKSDEERSLGKRVRQTLTPYEPIIRHLGGDANAIIADGMQALWVLNTGTPQQKADIVRGLVNQYGIDTAALGAQPAQGYVDPELAALKQQLAQLQGTIDQQRAMSATATQNVVNSEIAAFAADPAHPHFEAVRSRMSVLMSNGAADSLQDAYDQACWSNPDIRQSLISDKARQDEETRKKEMQAKAQQKRNAAVSVAGAPGNGRPASSQNGQLSLRDEIKANLRQVTSQRI